MAVITSYSTLLTAVGDYLARGDLTTFTPNFVQNCEERFYRDSENWASWMESALSVSIASGLAAVPANYLGLRVAYISGQYNQPLKRITLEQMYSRFPRSSTTGVPTFMTRNGANFEFGPIPADGSTLVGTYYAKPTVLRSYATGGADAVAHFLIVNAPDLLLYGALLEAEPFLKNDARVAMWKGAYDIALEAYRSRFAAEMSSGSTPFTVAV
jgi:hypothetical protein